MLTFVEFQKRVNQLSNIDRLGVRQMLFGLAESEGCQDSIEEDPNFENATKIATIVLQVQTMVGQLAGMDEDDKKSKGKVRELVSPFFGAIVLNMAAVCTDIDLSLDDVVKDALQQIEESQDDTVHDPNQRSENQGIPC